MAKLSQQLLEEVEDRIEPRATRTERVREQQRILREKKDFERLKSRAKQLQQTEFSEIESVGEYEQKYAILSTELKPFFQTPADVKQAEVDQINTTKVEIKERQIYADQQLQIEKERLDQKIIRYQEQREYIRNKGYDSETYRSKVDNLKQDLSDDHDRFEEKERYWRYYKQGLNEGYQQLIQGKNLSYSSIQTYADNLGSYEEEKKQARNEQRQVEYRQLQKIGDLEAQGYKPFVVEQSYKGQPQAVQLLYYHPEKQVFQKIQEYPISTKVDVRELEKLGSQPQIRTIKYLGREFKFPSRISIYKTKAGEVVTPYFKTGFTEEQLIKQSQDKAYQEWLGKQPTQEVTTVTPLGLQPISEKALIDEQEITTIHGQFIFGQPEQYAWDFHRATGSTSFTIAIPMKRENGMLRVQDFNFLFEDGKIVRAKPTGTALLTEEQYRKADKRRRDKYPLFTFGDTREIGTIAEIKDQPVLEISKKAIIDDRRWYDKSMEELFISPAREKIKAGAGVVWTGIKDIYEKIPLGRWYYTPQLIGVSAIAPYKVSERSIDLTAGIEKGQEFLGKISEDVRAWAVGKEKIEKLDIKLEEKYQAQYQSAFETKYMKEIIYGDIKFEKATKEFEESEEAKLLQEKYMKEYGEEYKEISQSASLGKKLAGGGAIAVLGISKLGLGFIKTPKGAVVTTGAVFTGLKLLRAIPPFVSYIAGTGLFAYGTYKAFSPTSTVEEAGGGLLTATIIGTTMGYGAVRYLRSPVVKTIRIKPKISTKTGRIIGYEQPRVVIKDIYGKTTIKEITKYPKTLSRQVIEGRRTIVTTKARQFLKMEDIYKGIPTQQLGKTYIARTLRGTYVYKTPSAYQKALKKLTRYGYAEAQAKATLRYYAPKIIETEISGVSVLTYGEGIKPYAVARTTVIKRQPIRIVDEKLGIKTRGARTIKEVYASERAIIKELRGYTLIREVSKKTTGFLTKEGGWYNKVIQAGRTTTQYERTILAKASEIKVGYAPREISKYYIAGQKYRYQTLKEIFAQRQIVPLKYQRLFGKVKSKLIKTEKVIYIDESKLTGIKVREIYAPKKVPKVRGIEEMSAKELKQMIRDLQSIYGKGSPIKKVSRIVPPTKDIEKVIAKLDEGIDIPRVKALDQYYGKGLYERTEGGLVPQQVLKTDILKQIQIPDIKITKIKDLIKIKQVDLLGLKMATLTGVSTKLLLDLKTDVLLKTDFKAKMMLKDLLKVEMALKQQPALKQVPVLKQALKLKLGLTPRITPITPTIFETPITPKIKLPTYKIPIIPPFLLKGRIEEKLLKKKRIGREFAYLPDFTARALGLDPDVISGKQAQARIRKILTGLEIRRGVIIK